MDSLQVWQVASLLSYYGAANESQGNNNREQLLFFSQKTKQSFKFDVNK